MPRSPQTPDRRSRPSAASPSRPGRIALSALLAAVLALGLAGPGARVARAADGVACGTWGTSLDLPESIRVLRVKTGIVDTVPFRSYVENVLAWEWTGMPPEALTAGAVAVKQYGLYYTMHARSTYVTPGGDCYDVRDDTNDQIYDPAQTPGATYLAAVEATWRVTVRHDSTFFLTGYRSGGVATACGAESLDGFKLYQAGVKFCANAGLTWAQILHVYLDHPTLSIAVDTARVSGPDRYGTAAAVSAATWAPGVPVAFVATGDDWPDALAGGPAAAKLGGPILLVTADTIPSATQAELERLTPARIVVLGGPGVVSDAVFALLGAIAPAERWSGADRYATAAAISANAFPDPGVPIVFVATGENFPDAVVGASAGAALGGPVLLVGPDVIPEVVAAELARLAPLKIRVLGGAAVVSDAVLEALKAYSGDVDRIAGPDRYATAAAVSAFAYAPGTEVRFATGANFPDALSVGPLGRPLLLVSSADSAEVDAEAVRLTPTRLIAVGGAGALSDAAVGQVITALVLAYGP